MVEVGLLVAFFFPMVCIGGGSLFPVVVHGGYLEGVVVKSGCFG